MDHETAAQFVTEAVRIVLKRTVSPHELATWGATVAAHGPTNFLAYLDTIAGHGPQNQIFTHWPNGHYYSPVVDPNEATRRYWEQDLQTLPADLHGIDLDLEAMIAVWAANAAYLLANPFPDSPNGETRYFSNNNSFPGGDAVIVGAMLRTLRPNRIIEIGSGNSTAAMLDWGGRLGLENLDLTCIEPDPIRLRAILRPTDRLTIVESPVQNTDLDLFRTLAANDVLFIDSTHVLKTASDVHFELFHILPILAPGVIVHFHDCAYPFDYPKEAVFDMNFSWNEAYALRAFLMYNDRFKVMFWNSMFYRFCPPEMRAAFASLSGNPGGGLWLKKQR